VGLTIRTSPIFRALPGTHVSPVHDIERPVGEYPRTSPAVEAGPDAGSAGRGDELSHQFPALYMSCCEATPRAAVQGVSARSRRTTDDPPGTVREMHDSVYRHPPTRAIVSVEMTVSPAPETSLHRPGCCREMRDTPPGLKKGHSFLSARQKDILRIQRFKKTLPASQRLQPFQFTLRRLLRRHPVRFEDGDVLIRRSC